MTSSHQPNLNWITQCTVKVKWSRYRPGVAQRVGRGIALLFHDGGTGRGWVVSSTPRPHFTPGKDPVSILQEAGWAPAPVWMCGKPRPTGIRSRTVQPVAQSLYRLSYPAHGQHNVLHVNKGKEHNSQKQYFIKFLEYNSNKYTGYMFRLISSHLQPPLCVNPDIQTFTALWDPKSLQNIKYGLYIKIKTSLLMPYRFLCIMNTFYSVIVGDHLEGPEGNSMWVEICSPYLLLLYSVIQNDGLNFMRLFFLKYTWYVNDLHNIWKRRY